MLSTVFRRSYQQFNVPEISSAILDGPRKVMLYRARQRGWLELDVILGSFAEKKLAVFNDKEVEEFGAILAVENPDLYKYVSGQSALNDELKSNSVFKQLLQHVNQNHPSLVA